MILGLALLFFNWRARSVSLVAIALSFVVAALVLHLFDTTFNAVVLAGLVIALAPSSTTRQQRRHDHAPSASPAADMAEATRLAGTLRARPSLEAGRLVVWATVIFALALVPIFLMGGLSGDSFFPPLAAACLSGVAGVAARRPHRHAGAEHAAPVEDAAAGAESAAGRWLQRGYQPGSRRRSPTAVPAFVAIARPRCSVAACSWSRGSTSRLLPELKDTNVLVHWDAPPARRCPRWIASRIARPRSCGPSPVCERGRAGRPGGARRPTGRRRLRRDVGQRRSVGRLRQDGDGGRGGRRRLSRHPPRGARPTPKERMRDVLGRTHDEITVRVFGSDLAVLTSKANEVRRPLAGVDGVTRKRVASPTGGADDGGRGRPGEGPGGRHQARRRPPGGGDVLSGAPRRQPLRAPEGLRRRGLGHAGHATSLDSVREPAHRHAERRPGPPGRRGRRAGASDAAGHRARRHLALRRRDGRTWAAAMSARWRATCESASPGSDFALEYHAELLGDYSHEQGASAASSASPWPRPSASSCSCRPPSASWRLAILSFLMLPVVVGGRGDRRLDRRGPVTWPPWRACSRCSAIAVRNERARSSTGSGACGPTTACRSVPSWWRSGTQEQLAPTLTAAIATALVPAACLVFGTVAGQEIVHPMAVVMLGGLVTSALVNLFVLPCPLPALRSPPGTRAVAARDGARSGRTRAGATTAVPAMVERLDGNGDDDRDAGRHHLPAVSAAMTGP